MNDDAFRLADKNIVDMRKKRNPAASAVRDWRVRLSSIGTGEIEYEMDLLRIFARNQMNAGFTMPLFVALVTVVFSNLAASHLAALWAAATIFAHLLLSALSSRFLGRERGDRELPRWRRNFLMGQGLIAGTWALFPVLGLVATGGYPIAIVQFSTLLVFQAVTAMQTYAFGRSVLIMAAPTSVLMSFRFIMTYSTGMVLMGIILITSLLFFYFVALRFRRSMITMLEHATEKETLIVELEQAKSFSEEARSRAEQANLAKSRFLATMSHELRTPLNAILGFSEIMRDEVLGPIGNENYKEYAKDIHHSGSHLLNLINEILDISRIEAGKHELKEAEHALVSVVDEAAHMMQIKAKQKGVQLVCSYEENLPPVFIDERAIRQVTLNLLSNALKFTPTGGSVTVKIGWTRLGGQYISIKDTGPGIPEDEIPIVLSSFGQGSIAIQHAEQGTGLGLTIVQGLINLHQGKFELKSKLREGTEVFVYLPKSRVRSEGRKAIPGQPPARKLAAS